MNPKVGYRNLWAEGEIYGFSSEYGQAPVEGTQEHSREFSWQSRHGAGSGNGHFEIAAPAELVTNGTFDSATTGWTGVSCSLASVAGGNPGNCLELTVTGGASQFAFGEKIVLTAGQQYLLTAYVKSGTAGDVEGRIQATDVDSYTESYEQGFTSSGAWTCISRLFTVLTTQNFRIYLYKTNATAGTMLFDNVSLVAVGTGNNVIDFQEGSDQRKAVLTAGTYNGQTLAGEVETQLNAAGNYTYTVTYDEAAAKFTIAGSSAFSVLWNAGKHTGRNAAAPLGFSSAADDTGDDEYISDSMVCHTSEFIHVDFGSAQPYDCIGILGHNLSSAAVVALIGADDDAFATNPVSDAVTYVGNNIWQILGTERTKAYIGLVITDPANPAGYIEVGPVFVGKLHELDREIDAPYRKGSEDPSVVEITQKGVALVTDQRESLKPWPITISGLTDAAMAIVQDLRDRKGIRPAWVFCTDTTAPNSNTYWVRIREDELPEYGHPNYGTWTVTLEEVV